MTVVACLAVASVVAGIAWMFGYIGGQDNCAACAYRDQLEERRREDERIVELCAKRLGKKGKR